MAIFKSISEKIRLMLIILSLVSIVLCLPAWAIISRIVGQNFVAGDGLYLRNDTLFVLPGFGMMIDNDSTKIDTSDASIFTTTIKDGNVFSVDIADNTVANGDVQAIDSTWITDGSIGTTTVKDGGIFSIDIADNTVANGDVQAIDSTWITDGSIGTTTIKNAGVFGVDIAGGQVVKYGRKSGGADAPIYDSLLFAEGTNVTLTQSGNTITIAASAGGAWYGQSINGGTLTTDTMVWLPEWGILMRETNPAAVRDTIAIKVDSTTVKGVIAYQIEDSLDGYWTSTATGGAINDSMWNQTPLPQNGRLSISEATDDSVSIIYPLATATVSWAVKHINESGAAANQMDTVVFSLRLPTGVPDIDSITFNMRSSTADTTASGLRVRCFKQTAELGSQTALTAGLIGYFTATDAWEHKTIAGADIGAVAGGNELTIKICVQTDAAAIVWHDEPKVWCVNKQ